MKKLNYNLFVFLAVLLFSLSYISSEIIFSQPVNPVYNIGDEVFVPLKIKSVSENLGILQLDLICNETQINFYKNGVKLKAGEEKSLDSYLVLIKEIIGTNRGKCRIKASFNEEYALTEEFKISDMLIVSPEIANYEFDIGQGVEIKGNVKKENSQNLEGFLEIKLVDEKNNIKLTQTDSINQGNIQTTLFLPKNLESKEYQIKFLAYEKNLDGEIINQGQNEKPIYIKQMPTDLEININYPEINPGTDLKISSRLKDQTGKEINATTFFVLSDSQDKILEQKEVSNGEELVYFIPEKEIPSEWKITAECRGISVEDKVLIKSIEKINVEIVNKTLILTNEGNVPYNKTLLVRIEDTPLNVDIQLKVGETKKYILNAPNGEYNIRLMTGEGEEISQTLSLTGRAISVREDKNVSFTLFGWIFLIVVLLFLLIRIIKKLTKRRFVGRMKKTKEKNLRDNKVNSKNNKVNPSFKELPTLSNYNISAPVNKAELSLSIKGTEQDVSAVCLKIKDLREKSKGSIIETIEKIKEVSQQNKGVVYENQDYLIFLFAPIKTRTLRNESLALNFAENIRNIIIDHNRRFNQKIENYGISLDNGTIVAKIEQRSFKFMAIGNLITSLKRISSLSNQEILLSQKMNDLLALKIKASREIREGTTVYTILSVKKEDEEATKFINRFLNRQ